MRVFQISPSDAQRYVALRRRMLEESPWAFGASPEDDVMSDPTHVAEKLQDGRVVIFAIRASQRRETSRRNETRSRSNEDLPPLVAAAGLLRMKPVKFAHRAKLWGVYVEPAERGRGMGRRVVQAAIAFARTIGGVDYLDLGVSENSPEARRLYLSCGFVAWGREPEATQLAGFRYDEIYMTLRLNGLNGA